MTRKRSDMSRRQFVALAAAVPGVSAVTGRGALAGGAFGVAQPGGFTFYSPLAEEWFRAGDYFAWTSTTRNNEGRAVNVFHRTFGRRTNPAIVLVHGMQSSSFDFRTLVRALERDYFLCVLDFPGFGFSDKPQDGYSYMIADDARLLDYYVREVVGLSQFHLLTHDRGVSVGLAFLGNYLDAPTRDYEIGYHFLSNSGSFLPLANRPEGANRILHRDHSLQVTAALRSVPRVTAGDPETVARADIQAFNDGIGAVRHIVRYQLERAAHEYRWLASLKESPVPTALFWGLRDTPNPVRVAHHVWLEYLNDREVESSFWLVPTAGHYPQLDAPGAVETVVRACLDGRVPAPEDENTFMWETADEFSGADSPVYVGRSHITDISFPEGTVEYSPSGYGG
jgi:pimeloyl-ACP methyl ester carboxylesterase